MLLWEHYKNKWAHNKNKYIEVLFTSSQDGKTT
jgi:hypothetical protein